MFVTLMHATRKTPILVNLDTLLYAYRAERTDATVLVFGQLVQPLGSGSRPAARIRPIAVTVNETLADIAERRRLAGT